MKPTIAWSNFAKLNSTPEAGNSYTICHPDKLIHIIQENWERRIPGAGEIGIDRKVLVPMPVQIQGQPIFFCSTVKLCKEMLGLPLSATVSQRRGQTQEDVFVETFITTSQLKKLGLQPEAANFCNIVCYHKDALLENGGERSSDADWEIVCILASPVENEPMHGLVMARNQLELVGGTKSNYSSDEYAKAIHYWSQRIKILPG